MNLCHCCLNVCEQSWMILKNENLVEDTEEQKAPQFLHYCSYLCHVGDRPNLPSSIWHLVQNKGDFNKDPRPITLSRKKEFQFLDYEEIQELTDFEKDEYYKTKNNQMDTDKMKFYEDQVKEDARTAQIAYGEDDSDDY